MSDHLSFARQVLRIEGEAILRLEARLGDEINRAVSLIVACSGRVVVTGMGKAGLVGRKISATLASTGVPSFFLHPAEAAHGDLGQVVDHQRPAKGVDQGLCPGRTGAGVRLSGGRACPVFVW